MRALFLLLAITCMIFTNKSLADDVGGKMQIQSKSLLVYTQPQTNSKVLFTLNQGQSVIPFYEQKDWIKIANPQTGDVGWVQKADLDKSTTTVNSNGLFMREYSITEKGTNNSPPKTYKIVVYSNKNPLDQQQAAQLLQQMKERQQRMQQSFDRMFNESFKDFASDKLFHSMDNDFWYSSSFPNVQTVIVLPQSANPGTAQSNLSSSAEKSPKQGHKQQ